MSQDQVRVHKMIIELAQELTPLERDCLSDVWNAVVADQRALSLIVRGTHVEAIYTEKKAEVFRQIIFDRSWNEEACLQSLLKDPVMQGLWKFHEQLTGLTFDQAMRQACEKVLSCRFEHTVPIPGWL